MKNKKEIKIKHFWAIQYRDDVILFALDENGLFWKGITLSHQEDNEIEWFRLNQPPKVENG